MKIKNYGLVLGEQTPDQYVLGGATRILGEVINPEGDWTPNLPEGENQARAYETFGCTVWGTENAIETLLKKRNNTSADFSERYPYNLAGINPPGADPHVVAEVIRKYKLIREESLPEPSTLVEFRTPRPMEQRFIEEGKKFGFDVRHEWVIPPRSRMSPAEKREALRDALTKGTVCVSVVAWKSRNGLYFKEIGETDTHWTMLASYKNNPTVYDSYPESEGDYLKDLEDGYDFGVAKVYYLDPALTPEDEEEGGIFQKILDILTKILTLDFEILKKRDEIAVTVPEPIDSIPLEEIPGSAE